MYRKTGYIIARIVGLLAVLMMAFVVAIQTPLVQTRLSKFALNKLASIMDGRITYDELKVMTSGVVVIRNIKLIDSTPYSEDINGRGWAPADTVFQAKLVTATFTLRGLVQKEGLHMGRVTIEDGAFHLVSEPGEEYHDNLSRIFHLKSTGEPPSRASLFDVKKLRIKNFHFQMNSFLPDRGTYKGFGLNFDDLDLWADIVCHNFRMDDAKIIGYIDRLEAREKSGYIINQFSASCEFGLLDGALIEDLRLRDPWSDIKMRTVTLGYGTLGEFSDFVNRVVIEADMQRTSCALQSLAYLTGAFNGSPLVINIQRGHIYGAVRDLSVDRLVFDEATTGVSSTVTAQVSGLPDLENTYVDAQVQDLTGTTTDFSHFIAGLSPDAPAPDFGQIAHNVPLTLQVTAVGPLNDLDLDVQMDSPSGSFSLVGDLRNLVDPDRPIDADLALATQELDLGDILGVDILGPTTLRTSLSAALSNKGLPDATLDSLQIERISALGKDFHDILVTGSLRNGVAEGHIQSADPMLRLDLTGLADLEPAGDRARYRLDGTIANADLAALGFDAGGKLSRVATAIHADLVRSRERFNGSARLDGVRLIDDAGVHDVGDIRIDASTDGDWQDIRLRAPFLDARFRGDRPVTQFASDLQEVTLRRELPTLFTDEFLFDGTGNYTLEANFHDTRDLLALFVPGAYVADGTSLTLTIDDSGLLDTRINSERIAFDKNFLRNVDIRVDNRHNSLFANIISTELRAANLAMLNPAISAGAQDDRLALSVRYDNFSGTGGDATLNLEGGIFRDEAGTLGVRVHPVGSYIMTGDDTWIFDENDITLLGKDLHLDHFLISNGAQRLLVDGGISNSRTDTLSLMMDRFDLTLVDDLLSNPIGIEGKMNGRASLTTGPKKAFGMLMDFSLDTLRLAGADAGSMRLSSQWHDEGKDLGILISNVIDGREAFRVNGSYFIQNKRLDIQATLDEFPLKVASGFLPDAISEIDGGISGSLSLTGPTSDLRPYSDDLRIQDALVKVGLTGVPYTVNGPIRIDETGCRLDGVTIRDTDGGEMNVNAALLYQHLKDFRVDGRVDFTQLKVLDSPERPGVPFYGFLRASGSARARGPLSSLTVDADVTTFGDGQVHLPMSGGASASLSGGSNTPLLTFTEPTMELDPYELMLADLHKKDVNPADVIVHARVTLLPTVRAFAEIDKSVGNVASFNGQGTVSINMRPSRALLELNGDYNISEGTYQFVLPGILSKTFSVQQGSSVKFAGDLQNTELDITATYGLRTSLDPLLNTENLSRRQVNCVININDRLRAPSLNLSIDVPDLDPSSRMAVESALSTSDKVQKQFVSLLLLGTFLPDENSGVFRQSNLLYSNVMEMMSGQINNVLQRLEIPVDVGFGYQEMLSGENLFDVSLSTELFENRVIVSGNFGNRRYSTGSASGDFTGDLDLQVKLDAEGKFRFNVFSHSSDEFTNFLDYSQRNGIGVSFQKEYTNFHEFLQSLFIQKKKRQLIELLEAEKNTEQVIIHIGHEPGETLLDTDAAR